MNTRTHSVVVQSPKSRVFAYLANAKNLPKWATGFCKKLESKNGHHVVTTADGSKVHFAIRADEPTGVIDMLAGPTDEQMAAWPARVVELPNRSSLFLFTAIQGPGVTDQAFDAQCAELKQELANVKAALE